MNKFFFLATLCSCLGLLSCSTNRIFKSSAASHQRLSGEDKKLADTLIKYALENEGLYTVSSGLKPMSTVTDLYLSIADKDTIITGKREVTDTSSKDFLKLKRYQRVINTLQFGDLRFMINPFSMTRDGKRTMHVSIHRKSLMDSLLTANQSFYGQFGFVPGSSPEVVVSATEYEQVYNRYRSYGYLFGYPEHAVTFFVEAAMSDKQKGKFVSRDFFQIPVYSSGSGRFVYAVPKGQKRNELDSMLLKRADYALNRFKARRTKHVRKDGSVNYYELLRAMIR